MRSSELTPERGLIFRITHVDNVPWLLDNGIHCRNSATRDPNFRQIGDLELIEKRARRRIPVPPHGTLSDYVPFYFTPWSPMLYKITTGHGGTPRTPSAEIAILVVKLATFAAPARQFLVTDSHAYLQTAVFAGGVEGLARVDWRLLQARDFKHSNDDPGKFDRYQAEALVHRHVPVECLAGIVTHGEDQRSRFEGELRRRGMDVKLLADRTFYFP